MNPLSCAEVEEQIDLYALQECDPATAAAVAAHLAGCRNCAQAYQEARRVLGLLDLHLRQERGLARLKGRIAAESRRTLRMRPPAVRRVLALAALLLVTLGLIWLAQPGPPGVSPPRTATLVARLTPREAVNPPQAMVQAPGAVPGAPEAMGTGARNVLTAHVAPASLKELEEGKRTGHPPLPPAIQQDLRLENTGPREMVLLLGEGHYSFRIDLEGPGVVRLPVPQDGRAPFAAPGKVHLPPGKSLDLPVERLSEVVAGKVSYVYWTKPGRYTLFVRLDVRVEGRAAPLTVTTPPIPVRVEAGLGP